MPKEDDTKYELKDRSQFHDGEVLITFRAQDVTLPAILECAAILSLASGSPAEYVDSLREVREEVIGWQIDNLEAVKPPD